MKRNLIVERARAAQSKDMTTGQVAALLGVSPGTVQKLMDSGRLSSYRVTTTEPGSRRALGDRRACRLAVAAYMRANGMSHRIPKEWGDGEASVQLIDLPDDVVGDVSATLAAMDPGIKVIVSRGLVAIAEAAVRYPTLVLVDVSIGRSAIHAIRAGLLAAAPNYRTFVVGVLSQDADHTVVSAVPYFGLDVAVTYPALAGACLFPALTRFLDDAKRVRLACLTAVPSMDSLYKRKPKGG